MFYPERDGLAQSKDLTKIDIKAGQQTFAKTSSCRSIGRIDANDHPGSQGQSGATTYGPGGHKAFVEAPPTAACFGEHGEIEHDRGFVWAPKTAKGLAHFYGR